MEEIHKKKIKDLIHTLGLKYNLSDEDIKNLVESPYEFTNEKIKNINYKDIDVEKVDDLKTTFLYLGFGRIFLNKEGLKRKLDNKINLNGRNR